VHDGGVTGELPKLGSGGWALATVSQGGEEVVSKARGGQSQTCKEEEQLVMVELDAPALCDAAAHQQQSGRWRGGQGWSPVVRFDSGSNESSQR
jgi:hypothetical protein